jgi:glycosyltransferase involved in cell wall biosynthesis
MGQARSAPPLVAIVTPVYNGEKYLAETMECVQSLDYTNLMHIVLDNASTDATPKIISRYRNGRVPILTSRNKTTIPMTANFNAALGMVPAEAGYFRILCADDTMAANAISRQVEIAERDPEIGIVGCQCRAGLLRGKGLPRNCEIFDGKQIIRSFFLREHDALHGTEVLVRRSKLDEQPFYYDLAFRGAADTDSNLRICRNNKFGFVHEELAMFHQHEFNHYRVFSRSYFHMPEWLTLLDRYGRFALSEREYRAYRSAYRRRYLRRLLLLRWLRGDKAAFDEHMAILRQNNDPAGWPDFADASAEWAFRFLTRANTRHSFFLALRRRSGPPSVSSTKRLGPSLWAAVIEEYRRSNESRRSGKRAPCKRIDV